MIKIDRTGEFDVNAAKVALDMYEKFVIELSTSLFNTVKYAKRAYQSSEDAMEQRYLQGRAQAFEEIIDRIDKERKLARQEVDNAVSNYAFDQISYDIGFHKNLDCEELLPDEKFRGKDYMKMLRFRGKIANLLEGYAQEGFNLGVRYARWKMRGEGKPEAATTFDREEIRKMIGLEDE